MGLGVGAGVDSLLSRMTSMFDVDAYTNTATTATAQTQGQGQGGGSVQSILKHPEGGPTATTATSDLMSNGNTGTKGGGGRKVGAVVPMPPMDRGKSVPTLARKKSVMLPNDAIMHNVK